MAVKKMKVSAEKPATTHAHNRQALFRMIRRNCFLEIREMQTPRSMITICRPPRKPSTRLRGILFYKSYPAPGSCLLSIRSSN